MFGGNLFKRVLCCCSIAVCCCIVCVAVLYYPASVTEGPAHRPVAAPVSVTQPETTRLVPTTTQPPATTQPPTTAPATQPPSTVPPTTKAPDFSYALSALQVVPTHTEKYTYEQMQADLQTLCSRYPDQLSLSVFGTSVDGRDLYCVRLGSSAAQRCILVQSTIHGREYMNTMLTMKLLEYYLYYYDTGFYDGVRYADIFEDTAVYIVPMLNPDGASISQSGLNGLRSEALRQQVRQIYQQDTTIDQNEMSFSEYLRKWKSHANGVDLNRNFAKGFGVQSNHTAPGHEKYQGPQPESEPETQSIIRLAASLPGLQGTLSFHSYGSMLYWECDQTGSYRRLCYNYAQLMRDLTGYRILGADGVPFMGSFADHVISRGIPNVTIETGNVNTPLPLSEFNRIFAETRQTIAAAAVYFASR